jgi:hypothetical protein
MKIGLLVIMICASINTFCQNNDKKTHAIDVDAIRETQLTGDVGLRPTIMSVPATKQQVAQFLRNFPGKKYLTFPENRQNSIRLLDSIPKPWLNRTPAQLTSFNGTAQPGEYFVFQIGVYAPTQQMNGLAVYFAPLTNKDKVSITDVTCFNTQGVDIAGKAYKKTLTLKSKSVLPLWFGILVPDNASGTYKGVVQIKPQGLPATAVNIKITIQGERIKNHGFNHDDKLSRLAWLNSKVALDNDITQPYKQLERVNNQISILGRTIKLSAAGLPQDIQTYFDKNNQQLLPTGEPILASKMKFIVEQGGKQMQLSPGATIFKDAFPGATHWTTVLRNPDVKIIVQGTAEFDGYIGYQLAVTPLKDIMVDDIRLEMPMEPQKSTYMMGLDKEGGFRPEKWNWKWDVLNKDQDEVWMGDVNGGLKIKFKGANYKRQLVNIYYSFGPINEPESWGNGQKGGINIITENKGALLKAYSGSRLLRKGQTYHYNFDLLVTPFKLINKSIQFGDRYYHTDIDTTKNFIKTAIDHGANIINIHHKKDIYPFLDYPFMDENLPDLKTFIDSSHLHGLKSKLYYTTRELSVNAKEIWAMRSLNNEIIFPGPGVNTRTLVNPKGVHPWLGANFKENFIPGWVATFTHGKYKGRQDLAVLTTPDSRMNNFYLEGLDWMCKNLSIDGIYLDDLALDRETMKRARKILDRERPGARVDMHTWNHYNEYGKFASSLNVYMDMLPYIDQLWIGEARNYDTPADYWLVEISGIPFGLTSQMLNKGGNPWRGMNYGITDRLGWFKSKTPEYMWLFWDEHNIEKKNMIGFWDKSNPVRSNNAEVEATIYKGRDEVLVSVANYTDKDQIFRLNIDWKALNLSPDAVTIEIPEITEFQEKRSIKWNDEIKVDASKGYIIVIKKKVVNVKFLDTNRHG